MTTTPADRFWSWSIAVYAEDGVKAALLALQDRHGYMVNVVLWAVWAAQEGYDLPPEKTRRIIQQVTDMDKFAVCPLRSVRRFLSAPHSDVDYPAQKLVRQQVLDAELATEKLIQATLATLTAQETPTVTAPPSREWIRDRAHKYFTVSGEYLESPRLLADEGGPDGPGGLFDTILRAAGWAKGSE